VGKVGGVSKLKRRCHVSGGPVVKNYQLGPPPVKGRMSGGFDMGCAPYI
jgi:hypothetical protein